jgi:hypothetical protein
MGVPRRDRRCAALCALVCASAFVGAWAAPGFVPRSAPEAVVVKRGTPATLPDLAGQPRDRLIAFALYTVHERQLKLTAQLFPLRPGESPWVTLEIQEENHWREAAKARVDEAAAHALFRVSPWDSRRTVRYRLSHEGGSRFEGTVRADPGDQDEIVLAALSCNSNADRSVPADVVANLQRQDPDLVAFLGDQVYDHDDALAGWISFGLQFRDVLRDRPSIVIPDDHDVGQGNLWGSSGRRARQPGGVDGGYLKPPEYVNLMQRLQTSHLPDPVDPQPVDQGIGVYFTALNLGGIGFAILEDRKWKTGPGEILKTPGPRPDLVSDRGFDPAAVDVPEAELLGERQLRFLRRWGEDWRGTDMKVVLSATAFGSIPHLHGAPDRRLVADLDSNGWPQHGRAVALEEIRRFFGLHVAGDQHLAFVAQYGIQDWEDAGYVYAVPSILNYFPRWWWPEEIPAEPPGGRRLPLAGRALDGLGNRATVSAYWNPTTANAAAAGYGLLRFRKATRQIVMECWPRYQDVGAAGARQCEGWPVTVSQTENYGRRPVAWLPPIEIAGGVNPVLRVFDDTQGRLVYSLRLAGTRFVPPVFRRGRYTIEVESNSARQILPGVDAVDRQDVLPLRIEFPPP